MHGIQCCMVKAVSYQEIIWCYNNCHQFSSKYNMERFMRFWSLWIHISQIAISSEQLTLSASYFQHFMTHHSYMWKCNSVSCTSRVSMLRGSIPHKVQNCHIFRYECSNCFKFSAYTDESCRYWLVLFVNHLLRRYRCAKFIHISHSIRANNFPIHWIGRGLPNWLAWNNRENVH